MHNQYLPIQRSKFTKPIQTKPATLIPDAYWTEFVGDIWRLKRGAVRMGDVQLVGTQKLWIVDSPDNYENRPLDDFKNVHEAMLYVETKVMVNA